MSRGERAPSAVPLERPRGSGGLTALLAVLFLLAASLAGAEGRHSLWRVRSGSASLYLLGSIHAMPAAAYPLAPELEEAFARSEGLVLELDPSELESPRVAEDFARLGRLPSGTTLGDVVSAETLALVRRRLVGVGLDAASADALKPWMVALLIGERDLAAEGYSAENGIDRHFLAEARQRSRPVRGLETARDQLAAFDGLSAKAQEALLAEAAGAKESAATDLAALTRAWSTGNLEELSALVGEGLSACPELERELIRARNARWVVRLDELLAGGKTWFVVVGVGHMPGDGGLLRLLARKGYAVEQL